MSLSLAFVPACLEIDKFQALQSVIFIHIDLGIISLQIFNIDKLGSIKPFSNEKQRMQNNIHDYQPNQLHCFTQDLPAILHSRKSCSFSRCAFACGREHIFSLAWLPKQGKQKTTISDINSQKHALYSDTIQTCVVEKIQSFSRQTNHLTF